MELQQLLIRIAAFAFTAFSPTLLQKFNELLSDHSLSYLFSFGDVEPEVKKLQDKYNRIEAVFKDADKRRIEDAAVKDWLRNLRDVHLDADDILDEFRTFLAVCKLNQELKSKKRKRQWYGFSMPLFPSWSPSPMCKRRRIKGRIGEIHVKLDAISKDRQEYRLKPEDGERKPQSGEKQVWEPTGSLQDESQVLGREEDLGDIVTKLKENNDDDIKVVPICGIGGLGKTTLAQLAFGHSEIKELFRLRIWVSMREDFDAERTTKEIIEVITRKKCDALSFDILQNNLQNRLKGKRFLLVLDNLWREDLSFWEALEVPLVLARSKGSKVLVTTRSRIVCNIMSREPPILLKGLNFESCWLLFKERAFAPGQAEDPNLVAVGRQIVERCQGLPMVVKLLGRLLHTITEEDEWMSVQREIREVEEGEDSILQTLKVSYDHLPLHLKHCFAYCSVFPVGHEFDKDELVKLWMAVGLIPSRGIIRPETVGDRYFNYLLWRSFFQKSVDCYQLNVKYKMPTVIHNLAQSVRSGEFLRVEHNERQGGDDKVRFAFCSRNYESFSEICQSESLRTLFLHSNSGTFSIQDMASLLQRFRCLRVLDLRNNQLEQLPNSIGDLTHLRYLSLYNTQIKCLPESVSSLYNLQTLNLGECYKLVELPEGFQKLVNLRHLNLQIDWDKWTDLNSMPPGISDLKSLQTMSRFVVSKKSGCGIRELKDLKLRGELCISKLENVEKIDDAKEAELKNKQYVEKLMLKWSAATNSNRQNSLPAEELIKYLQPHNRLKHLRIDLYDGTQFPQWLADSSFSCLESITLSNCRICTVLPEIDELPNLRNLVLKDCEKLTAIPHLRNIQTLVVEGCNKSAFSMLSGLTSLSSLTSLTISRCGDIKVQKSSFEQLSSLKELKIEGCNKLVSVAREEDLRNLSCLESLEISSCQELETFADMGLPPSLSSLKLHCCEKLDNFPIQLHLITPRLDILALSRCSLLKEKLQSDGDYLARINEKNIE